jgi:hypothetical protein
VLDLVYCLIWLKERNNEAGGRKMESNKKMNQKQKKGRSAGLNLILWDSEVEPLSYA